VFQPGFRGDACTSISAWQSISLIALKLFPCTDRFAQTKLEKKNIVTEKPSLAVSFDFEK